MRDIVKYIVFIILFTIGLILNIVVKMDLMLRFINPLIFCIILCLYRIVRGPTPADRAVAVDILGLIVVGACGIIAMFTKINFFIDIGIAWVLQSFISNIALSKYLEGRNLDE
jgi:multicomponent Na+:H+ antiporter subunit F